MYHIYVTVKCEQSETDGIWRQIGTAAWTLGYWNGECTFYGVRDNFDDLPTIEEVLRKFDDKTIHITPMRR